jgi:transcriptional regulator with XRE-family HTH domain
MLDQKRTGMFILELRKEKGYTQKQLADRIGVSDKAISRWETGRGLPDTSIMPALCEALSISVNELLSGERLSLEDYSGKAEEIMVDFMKNKEDMLSEKRKDRRGILIGFALIILMIAFSMLNIGASLVYYLDIPSAMYVVGIMYFALIGAGYVRMFHKAFGVVFSRKKLSSDECELLVPQMEDALGFATRMALIGGGLASALGYILIMAKLYNSEVLGPNLAVNGLPVFYAILVALFLQIVKARIHRMR